VCPVRGGQRRAAADLRPGAAAAAGRAAASRVQSLARGAGSPRGPRPVPGAHGRGDPQRRAGDPPAGQPRAMTRRLEFWELTACGAAAGGTGVWGLAAAARVGWMRAFLGLFPHSTCDALTWGLSPAPLLLSAAAH